MSSPDVVVMAEILFVLFGSYWKIDHHFFICRLFTPQNSKILLETYSILKLFSKINVTWKYNDETNLNENLPLTLKAPITTKADDDFDLFLYYFQKKTSPDISCESSAKQMMHMKYQDCFLWKIKNENFRLSSATNFAWRFKG